MEFIKNSAARFGSLLLIVCLAFFGTMAFTSCTDEEEEDEDGYRTFSSAFDLKFTRVERVGSVLIVDFTLKNKSGKDIRDFKLSTNIATDNNGKEYYYNGSHPFLIRFEQGDYYRISTTSIAKGETINGTFRIGNFDISNSARTVKLMFRCEADEVNINPYTDITTTDLRIDDNRILSNGIQTNDFGMDYVLEKTYQDGTDVYLTFALTNNTGNFLSDLEIESYEARDQNGNYYYHQDIGIAVGNSTNYPILLKTDINRGATETFTVKISNVKNKVSKMNLDMKISSPAYVFADDILRFITVPVPYQKR